MEKEQSLGGSIGSDLNGQIISLPLCFKNGTSFKIVQEGRKIRVSRWYSDSKKKLCPRTPESHQSAHLEGNQGELRCSHS